MGTNGQVKGGVCDKPPEIASQPNSSGDNAKLKMFKAVGTVTLLINESGDVIETKIQSVHPEVARNSLTAVTKTVKFRPCRGCGPTQVMMVFSGQQPGRIKN